MLMQRSQVRKWFIESKMKAYIQRKSVWSDPESGSRIKRGGALPMKYSKYFGAKRRGFIRSKSVLAPKGAIHLLNENIRYDICFHINFLYIYLMWTFRVLIDFRKTLDLDESVEHSSLLYYTSVSFIILLPHLPASSTTIGPI